MMNEVNPYASPQLLGLSARTTRLGAGRCVFWLATMCLFVPGAVLTHLGTIPVHRLNPALWLIVPTLWFVPIIVSDIRAGARRADLRQPGAFTFIVNMAKVIGIIFLIIFISILSAAFIDEVLHPSASVRFPSAAFSENDVNR